MGIKLYWMSSAKLTDQSIRISSEQSTSIRQNRACSARQTGRGKHLKEINDSLLLCMAIMGILSWILQTLALFCATPLGPISHIQSIPSLSPANRMSLVVCHSIHSKSEHSSSWKVEHFSGLWIPILQYLMALMIGVKFYSILEIAALPSRNKTK